MTIEEWIALGVDSGYVEPPMCTMHNGVPADEWELENDWCVYVLRIIEAAA